MCVCVCDSKSIYPPSVRSLQIFTSNGVLTSTVTALNASTWSLPPAPDVIEFSNVTIVVSITLTVPEIQTIYVQVCVCVNVCVVSVCVIVHVYKCVCGACMCMCVYAKRYLRNYHSLTSSRSQAVKVADNVNNCDGVSPDAMAAFTSNTTGRPLPPSFLLTDLEPDTQYCLRALASYDESSVSGIVEPDFQAGPGTLHRTAGQFINSSTAMHVSIPQSCNCKTL